MSVPEMTHCMQCGAALVDRYHEQEKKMVPYCPVCRDYRFPVFNTAVSMIVMNEEKTRILLIKQYGRDSYILVAGYVNRGECAEDAVRREVMEELGLTVKTLHFNRSRFFAPSNTLMLNFTVTVEEELPHPNEEVDSYQIFTRQEARENIRRPSLAQEFLDAALDDMNRLSLPLFIASDLHGSAVYTEQMLSAFHREKADRMLLLGDILYHGPRNDLPEGYAPKKVFAMLNACRDQILCVRGNCDTEVDQMVLDFPVLSDYALVVRGGVTLYATHGHVYHPDHMPPMRKGEVLLYGHTHVPDFGEKEGIFYANPGSVSIPKNGSSRGYMLLSGRTLIWKTLDGTIVRSEQLPQ